MSFILPALGLSLWRVFSKGTHANRCFHCYENIACSACRALQLPKDNSNHGQLNLEQLGKQLAAGNKRTQQTTELITIEIHRGLPNQNRDPQANQSARYWQNHWKKASQLVTIKFRPLRYRKDRDNIIRGEEKGVDVQLAVSTIRWIMKNDSLPRTKKLTQNTKALT